MNIRQKIAAAERLIDEHALSAKIPLHVANSANAALNVARSHMSDYETKGGRMPQQTADDISSMLDNAVRIVKDAVPAYRDDDQPQMVTKAIDDDAISGSAHFASDVAYLTKADTLVDYLKSRGSVVHSAEYRYGRLGAGVMAAMGHPQQLSKFGKYDPPEIKDMSTTGASVLVPPVTSAQLIDELRARTHVIALGARTVPMGSGELRIPRITGGPSAQWLAEGSAITDSDATVDAVTLKAKRLASLTRASEEVTEDSDPVELGRVLSQALAADFAVELDRVALRGSGTDPEPAGVRNQSGVTLTALGGDASWTTLTDAARTLADGNSTVTGYVTSPRTLTAIETEREGAGTGQFVTPPALISDIPRRATTQVPTGLGAGTNESEVYAGDWSQLLLGVRVNFELRVLTERYADFGQVGFVARLRADVALEHGAAFNVVTGVTN